MATALEKYKGIHPGFILERELKKRGIVKSHFAQMVKEHPQTLNDIYKGRRKLTLALSFKIDDALSLPEGTMYNLQSQFEMQDYIKKFRRKVPAQAAKFRPGLFWDTDINKIDWEQNAEAVIKRVFERGNQEEKDAIIELYGESMVQVYLKNLFNIDLSRAYANIKEMGWHLDLSNSTPKGITPCQFENPLYSSIRINPCSYHPTKHHDHEDEDSDYIERLIRKNR